MNFLLFPKVSVIHIAKSVLFIIQVLLMKSMEEQLCYQRHLYPILTSDEVHHSSPVFVHSVYDFDWLSVLEKWFTLFFRISAPKIASKSKSSKSSKSKNRRRSSIDHESMPTRERRKTLSTISYRTDIRPKTINPEWNEHFDLYVNARVSIEFN